MYTVHYTVSKCEEKKYDTINATHKKMNKKNKKMVKRKKKYSIPYNILGRGSSVCALSIILAPIIHNIS